MPFDQRSREKRGPAGSHPYNLSQAMARFECGYLANILELTRWNRIKAARMLGIKLNTLENKIRDYQLSPGKKPSPESQ